MVSNGNKSILCRGWYKKEIMTEDSSLFYSSPSTTALVTGVSLALWVLYGKGTPLSYLWRLERRPRGDRPSSVVLCDVRGHTLYDDKEFSDTLSSHGGSPTFHSPVYLPIDVMSPKDHEGEGKEDGDGGWVMGYRESWDTTGSVWYPMT